MATASKTRLGRRHKPCHVCGKDHDFWWASHKRRWMLSVEKPEGGWRQINLGDDHGKAEEKWHRIELGLDSTDPVPFTTPSGKGDTILIGELAEAFIADAETKLSPKRFRSTRFYVNSFVERFGGDTVASMRIGGVARIDAWIASKKTWAGCRPDVVSRIRQIFNWSVKQGFIATSPVHGLVKGKYGQRVTHFSAEQEAAILKAANPFFALGFEMLILTGCRPDEICSLEASNVHNDKSGFYLLVKHKTQHLTGKPRRVFLVPRAAEIIRQQLQKYPKGRLFRSANKTSDGVRPPLSPEYFSHAFRDLCEDRPELVALGLDEYKMVGGKRKYEYVAYSARHTFAVRYLTGFYSDTNGNPIILTYGEVAALLGNSAAMVEKVYAPLVDQTKFLTDRLCGTFGK